MPWSTDRCEPNTARRWLLEVIQGIFKEVFVAGDFTRGVVVISIGLIMLLSGVLAACSHQYNWREIPVGQGAAKAFFPDKRSEEHTYELQALMSNSYAVFCLKKKNNNELRHHTTTKIDTPT